MNTKFLSSIVFLFILSTVSAQMGSQELLLKASAYELDITIDYENERMEAICDLIVTNPTEKAQKTVPLLLHRLLRIASVKDAEGNSVKFKQEVVSFEDWEKYQVNHIQLELDQPLRKTESMEFTINYGGYLVGYTETGMNYVKDHINPDFTIIRPDCNAYPMLGYPSFEVNDMAGFESFEYKATVKVPDSLIVANGGRLINHSIQNGKASFTYESIMPSWRIDIAIARYNTLKDDRLSVFAFPEDSVGADRILSASRSTWNLYEKWWGKLDENVEFKIIEIPEGWGSQADVTCILQSTPAFKETGKSTELYHEISHLWNIKSNDRFDPRWNEGLAMFLQYLTQEKLEEKSGILEEKVATFMNRIKKSKQFDAVPMIDFGKEQLTGNSYITGMIMFYILYDLLGEMKFNELIKEARKQYKSIGATTQQFFEIASKSSSKNLNLLLEDWMFSTQYVDLIRSELSIKELIERYR
ncbi:MAG: M1 family aminopeptidase [Cytophagales bacterium]